MPPSSIYSSNSNTGFRRRKTVVVAAGITGAMVLLIGAGVGFNALRTSTHKSPSAGKISSANETSTAGSATNQGSSGSSPKKETQSNPKSGAAPTNSGSSQSTTQPKAGTGAAPSTTQKSAGAGGGVASSGPTVASPSYTPPPLPTSDACGPLIRKSDGSNWRCVFNDDFDGVKVNPANWAIATSPNDFFQWFECYSDRSQNVSVGNGKLYLSSRREIPQIPCGHVGGKDFSGGMVRTLQKYHLNKGKVDIRIKFPPSNNTYGVGTSLWLFHVPAPGSGSDAGAYGKWPASGEIDIAEQYAPFDDYVNPSLHYNVQSGHRLQSSCGQENYNAETTTARCLVSGATTSFHTYSVEWTTDTITMLYDGKPVFVDKWKSTQGGTAPFDQPFYLNITQGFSNLPIPGPYGAALPATAEVEYVKIWQ